MIQSPKENGGELLNGSIISDVSSEDYQSATTVILWLMVALMKSPRSKRQLLYPHVAVHHHGSCVSCKCLTPYGVVFSIQFFFEIALFVFIQLL